MGNYKPKYELSSYSENLHKFNKYYLYNILVLFYTPILPIVYLIS